VYASEVIALMVVFGSGTFVMSTSIVCMSWLVNSLMRKYFVFRERELTLRRWEAEARLETSRQSATIPAWVDRGDPLEVAAWNRAVAETWRVSATRALAHLD